LKYTGQLDLVWNMPFAGQINAISVNPAGNIIVTGKNTTSGDFLTGMYDSEQNEIWLSSYSGGAALVNSEMTIDANGIAYISGMVSDSAAALYKFVVITYDESGVVTPFIELDAYDSASRVDGIVVDSVGNVYLANDYGSRYGASELVSKYSPEGVLLWDTTAWNYYYQHGTGGMAIDANVLVFERVREEVRNGKTVRAAIEAGFAKAFRTIVDANVTTFIAAIVLFQFGTGPIKGFAITLCIGIAASMFTAVFVSRTIFDSVMSRKKMERLSI